jgi:hypothetical protein
VNVRTNTTLWIELTLFEECGNFLADSQGLLLFYCECTETMRLFNPLTTVILCTTSSDGHCRTVVASFVWVEDSGMNHEEKPDLVGMGVVERDWDWDWERGRVK